MWRSLQISEIIDVHVGKCGNQIAARFWQKISSEHGINIWPPTSTADLQNQCLTTYFRDEFGRLVPRAVLIDLEPGTTDAIRASPVGQLFDAENVICGKFGAGNNWAKGFYDDGAELADQVMDAVRTEAERCDALGGFQLFHSLGGGTGSGLGSLVLTQLREQYPKSILATLSVLPANRAEIVVEPYNAVLSMQHLIQSADSVSFLQNDTIYDAIKSTVMGDVNQRIAEFLSCSTAPQRQGVTNLHKVAVALQPFPRLHFLSCSFSGVSDVERLFAGESAMTNPVKGTSLSSYLVFSGYSRAVSELNCSFDTISVVDSNCSQGVALLSNSTNVANSLQTSVDRFNAMFKRRAFLQYYLGSGMDDLEFSESIEKVAELISEYQLHEVCGTACEE